MKTENRWFGKHWSPEEEWLMGSAHDILFYLKSLQLDMKKMYPFGTVFAYGYEVH